MSKEECPARCGGPGGGTPDSVASIPPSYPSITERSPETSCRVCLVSVGEMRGGTTLII